jgi:hypothetical protein
VTVLTLATAACTVSSTPAPSTALPRVTPTNSAGAPASSSSADVPALTVADPRIVVSPAGGLHDGQTVTVSVTGFSVGGKQSVSECSSVATATDVGCGSALPTQTLLVTGDDRTGSTTFTVQAEAHDKDPGGSLHQCQNQCVLVVTLGVGYPFAVAPLAFGP